MTVFDASAVLALLLREPGADKLIESAPGAWLSSVNLSEVLSRFTRDGHAADAAFELVSMVGLEIIQFDDTHARIAASLTPLTASAGLSLGDRACLALGLMTGRPVWTADRAWTAVSEACGVVVHCIR